MKIDQNVYRIFWTAAVWAVRSGNTVTVVSGNDHLHSTNSDHYSGRALDFHSSDMAGLNAWLNRYGYRTLWQVTGHFYHVHGSTV